MSNFASSAEDKPKSGKSVTNIIIMFHQEKIYFAD
jgi:hypothetical protein